MGRSEERERDGIAQRVWRWMTALHARAGSNTSLAMRPKEPRGKSARSLFDRENDSWQRGDELSGARVQTPLRKSGRGPSWAQFQKEAADRPDTVARGARKRGR